MGETEGWKKSNDAPAGMILKSLQGADCPFTIRSGQIRLGAKHLTPGVVLAEDIVSAQ